MKLTYPIVLLEFRMPPSVGSEICRLVQLDARRSVAISCVDGVWEDPELADRLNVDDETEIRLTDSLVEQLLAQKEPEP